MVGNSPPYIPTFLRLPWSASEGTGGTGAARLRLPHAATAQAAAATQAAGGAQSAGQAGARQRC